MNGWIDGRYLDIGCSEESYQCNNPADTTTQWANAVLTLVHRLPTLVQGVVFAGNNHNIRSDRINFTIFTVYLFLFMSHIHLFPVSVVEDIRYSFHFLCSSRHFH